MIGFGNRLVLYLQTGKIHKTVSFQADATTTVDIYLLQNALAANDLSQWEQVLALYKGPLLNNFYVENAPRFNEWLLLVQEQWRQRVTVIAIIFIFQGEFSCI